MSGGAARYPAISPTRANPATSSSSACMASPGGTLDTWRRFSANSARVRVPSISGNMASHVRSSSSTIDCRRDGRTVSPRAACSRASSARCRSFAGDARQRQRRGVKLNDSRDEQPKQMIGKRVQARRVGERQAERVSLSEPRQQADELRVVASQLDPVLREQQCAVLCVGVWLLDPQVGGRP